MKRMPSRPDPNPYRTEVIAKVPWRHYVIRATQQLGRMFADRVLLQERIAADTDVPLIDRKV